MTRLVSILVSFCWSLQMCQAEIHIAVVGAGPMGLTAAALARHAGYQVTVFEKQSAVGGDWLRWGNTWSKLQSHRDGYLIGEPEELLKVHNHRFSDLKLPSYPSRDQMLKYFEMYVDVTDIRKHILFNANVTGWTRRDDGKLNVYYSQREKQVTQVTHIFAAPGRVNSRHKKQFLGEELFQGKVAWGNEDDLKGYAFAGKQVIIVGHGSFAIESARHALEMRAKSVTIVARHEQLVLSRLVSFIIDRNVDRFIPYSHILDALSKMYKLIGYDSSQLAHLLTQGATAMTPTSDFYFLAQQSKKLKVVIGEVTHLDKTLVHTSNGTSFPADVFIKCIGFSRDTDFDGSMAHQSSVADQMWNRFVDDKKTVYLSSSANVKTKYDATQSWDPNTFVTSQASLPFLQSINREWPYKSEWEVDQIHAKLASARQTLEQFMAEQQHEWAKCCDLLGVDCVEYPYHLSEALRYEAQIQAQKEYWLHTRREVPGRIGSLT